MTSEDIQNILSDLLEGSADDNHIRSVRTYEDVGILTRDRGLVVRFDDNSEFQITIKQSR